MIHTGHAGIRQHDGAHIQRYLESLRILQPHAKVAND
jgi:hypothetical protein